MRTAPWLLTAVLGLAACGGEDPVDELADHPEAEQPGEPGSTDPGSAPTGPIPDPSMWRPVSGVARFEGTPPVRRAFNITEGVCLKHHTGDVLTEDYLIADGKVQNVIVFVQRGLPDGMLHPAPDTLFELDQLGCVYDPHVFALRAGQEILLANSDDTAHNVRTASVRRNGTVNANVPPMQRTQKIVFERAEMPVKLVCDIHPWMSSFFGVFDHPYFVVTGADGAFALDPLPPGNYVLRAWHEELGRIDQDVVVTPDGAAALEFVFKAAK
ncbi:MAG TPA: carboxypeptidase regulatory-like domain-containing protein [Planctomycetota bacterium]